MHTPPQPMRWLPTEMLVKILDALDFYSLLKCRQVGVRHRSYSLRPLR